MSTENQKTVEYKLLKSAKGGKCVFIALGDNIAVEVFRSQHNNENLHISVCSYNAPEPSAPQTYPLYFKIASNSSENVLKAALEICFYISDNFSIPQDCIEVIYTGGGNGMDARAASASAYSAGESGNNADNANSTTAETVILVPPIVFAGQPTLLMQLINYQLARQLVEDVSENIDIDVYHRDYLIRMPNSINSQTNRYVIPLTIKELLYMDAYAIAELSKQPRAEDSLIIPRVVPEAVEWFNEVCKEEEKRQYRQSQLQKLILENGWQITPCIRRLTWTDLSKEQAFEACRIISQFYSWIKAGTDEIWHYFQQIDRQNRNGDYQRLRAILNFAVENPGFVGCEHPLLKRFCPAGKCFIKELIDKYEKPKLFNNI
ncbi:MAG: hypothetical protein NTW55_06440 [Planctomycetota bacterium]|nr:hypothetical protein [Planctomycetota bacterium]